MDNLTQLHVEINKLIENKISIDISFQKDIGEYKNVKNSLEELRKFNNH